MILELCNKNQQRMGVLLPSMNDVKLARLLPVAKIGVDVSCSIDLIFDPSQNKLHK